MNSDGMPDDVIEIREKMLSDLIIHDIFGDSLTARDISSFSRKTILCPKKSDVDEINEKVLRILEGEFASYLIVSSDSIDDETEEDRQNYPIEFLNNLTPSGMPLHTRKLNLKVAAIVMLLRNLRQGF